MSETRDQTSGRNFGWIRSNVAVDLDVDNDILPASLCSPSACSVGAAGCDPPPGRSCCDAPSGPFSSPPIGERMNMEAPPVEDASAANQQKWLKIKTITQTGEEEVGEMIIEVPQQHDQAANMSSDSLDRTDPDHLKLNVNFHLSEDGREGDGSADDFKALRPKNASDGAPPGRFDMGQGDDRARCRSGEWRGRVAHTYIPSGASKPQVTGLEN